MAVAVHKGSEAKVGGPAVGLASASLLGAVYFVLGFVVVYHLLPLAWETYAAEAFRGAGFLGSALKLTILGLAAVGWVWAWPRLIRDQPGLNAGVGVGVLFLLLGLLVVYLATNLAELVLPWLFAFVTPDPRGFLVAHGLVVAAVVAGATALLWLMFMIRRFHRPTFQQRLLTLEEQGWFTLRPYKKGQGLRARRGTMLGILLIVGAGIYVYLSRLSVIRPEWAVSIPFTQGEYYLPVLYTPQITLAVLVAALTIWFAYRVVNYPRFADFLIATEAEMNKVSWSTRARLIQDTIVVLTTVLLLAVFLFVVDQVMIHVLRWTGVLQIK
jgi:preprotein translocase SecE subunit